MMSLATFFMYISYVIFVSSFQNFRIYFRINTFKLHLRVILISEDNWRSYMVEILLIEDDTKISESIREYLTNIENGEWRIHISVNGEDGLNLASQTLFSLILLDIGLPKRDGFEICKRLRQRGIQTPVIFITARYSESDVLKGYECGGDDYLIKPFSLAQLAAKIRVFLKRYGENRPVTVSFMNLTADRREKKLYLNDEEIALYPKEFDILVYLMEHPERLVSKDELITRVWGDESDVIARNLDNPIKNIRKQIEKSDVIIVTYRGYGYRMESKND